MTRTKNHSEPSSTAAEVSDISKKAAQNQREEEHVKEESDQSDLESLPSPSISKKRKVVAKRKPRKNVPASPAVTSSSTTTPQPEQGPKRKGGNKRKWTHEYCLTCTRYGRACGGRREGEEGCAVCRDPDRSKGEKLRECLWADPEAGITDYKTAREIFKKAQAEARAKRARPQSKRQQSSNAPAPSKTPRHSGPALDSSALASKYFPTDDLPRTNKPLDLQPPTLVRSSYMTQQTNDTGIRDDTVVVDCSQLAVYPSVASAPYDDLPRIHRPELTYVTVDSDNEKTVTTGQYSRSGLTSRKHQGSHSHQSHALPIAYFDAELNAWVTPISVQTPSTNASRYYKHPYRSAYDAPPAPPANLISQAHNSQQLDFPQTGSFVARTPAIPSSLPLDKSGTPPRKWSTGGSRITSLNGYGWKTKGWLPTGTLKNGGSTDAAGNIESNATITASFSDASSLSSYMSIDEDTTDGVMASKSGNEDTGTNASKNADDTDRPMNHLKRKFENTTAESARPVQASNSPNITVTTNNAVLRINLDSPITKVSTNTPDQTQENKNPITFRQPISFEFPGEITIQQDEEAGTSASDSELSSDEGKLKSLPAKLRKVLSRSRITKVIIGDDVFEIRPKTRTSSAKVHKKPPTFREVIRAGARGKGHKKAGKRSVQTPVVENTDEVNEDDHNTRISAQNEEEEMVTKRPPIKIKLIFNRKLAADSRESLETTSKPGVAKVGVVDTSTVGNDNEMDDA